MVILMPIAHCEFMDEEELVCLNDGSGTRMDVVRGTESAIDLTLATITLADKCEWEVLKDNAIGSDHFPIKFQVGMEVAIEREVKNERWVLEKADWEKFREISEEMMSAVDRNTDIESLCKDISVGIIRAASVAIPKSKPKKLGKIVPWWTSECKKAIKDRNKVFRVLKRTHNYQNLIEFKKSQAVVRKTIREANNSSVTQ